MYFAADFGIRLGLVIGFLVGHFNIGAMAFLMAKMLSTTNSKNALFWGALMLVKILILFGLVAVASEFWHCHLLAVAEGYLSVLFVVVLGVGFGYKPARPEIV